ncbi:MAG: ABC transporter permease subunit [Oscillospiraceae bacterium]|nr:ABC transporter permease subunit [Oscillospiraceae bacterium]
MQKNNSESAKIKLQRALGVVLALLLWQLAAKLINSTVLLATPLRVAKELFVLLPQKDFWGSIAISLTRIIIGYVLAFAVGFLLALFAKRFQIVESLLWPLMAVIKATPVASFIILCLIFLSSKNLSVFISFLMVLPIIYTNVLGGLQATDKKLLEMAEVFKVGRLKRFFYIYLPQLKSYIFTACSMSLGIAWKSGVAAEVIGIPSGSMGERLYMAKVYLDSPELFAWTVVIIVVSVLFEKLFMLLLKGFYRRLEAL